MTRNQVVIEGTATAIEPLRYTPAGIPVAEFRLRHSSMQDEAGQMREVKVELQVAVLGTPAQIAARLVEGQGVAVKGFLVRRSMRSEYPVLHATALRNLQDQAKET